MGEPGELPACLQAYDDRMNDFRSNITSLVLEESDTKFIEVYEKLRSFRGTENVAYHCTIKDLTDNPIPKKFGEFEKALVLTIYLMGDVARSSPAKAPKALSSSARPGSLNPVLCDGLVLIYSMHIYIERT
ncbi:hypothetical protein U9M48_021180 [Paspalum notatum var. saurae]|uniref:Uncharacterized protein n=1 Tax=Paspalum notatum var. saurae TaxID=547442 RepID=A0AAQ3WTM4_PASNO